ncbi:cobalt-zinc-cadmium efflux system protein [Actinokineospora alba]|uniref:Cobalt-zinc-cadmium efflux system protein n=1 Tax=Actinokineospora alba TaxID=504798 RepID=A0A1H0HH59_9PSEU|nr:cation diffusion facilitator family transporter [Actinokineospora alba]TDP64889.1 cobalt-zinc-cadmium efflux system protein [Actinokineospora alba]SDH48482.1 cobalt-zinc-cadmium efflux system protein [Actinokineospora alba]SDO18430.1 cobalt-zinc-cadmium efflux system protein [Actinokineospora alba]
MGHGHGHGTAASASGRMAGRLWAAFGIAAAIMVLEFVVGFATSSLALVSDAAHMLTDVVGVGLALAAIMAARRAKAKSHRTFGLYRAEVLAALANAVLLFGVAGYVVYEAVDRFDNPPAVPGWPVLLAALAGLAANVVSFLLLRDGAKDSLNVRGAYLEVLADLIGSVGVLISALVTILFGWRYADPIVGVAIGLWVLPRTWGLARRALHILFQHAPERVDVEELTKRLCAVPGVAEVHDVHVWTLTSGMEVASAHLTITADADQAVVLRAAQELLTADYGLEHATLQVESPNARCQELSW